eukprot:gnl/TRDRNA2_/TRDRNA2_183495_c0_seq1.p2 gnl/TRDRNA2_/TRDRNA2_183495_c0~~gnl/TRDRNA2_/TRDRNA2_183495_c0_seq1.p2  ORF type:complete len:110 (+),score=34.75 gnl/TRDRNA2_/TRDRNA2_183495_c0_seq1:79-408(+)
MAPQDPKAVQQLVSDLKMVVAYETAAEWRETKAMESAFNAFSWEDPAVKAALPKYLESSGEERAKVDAAFAAMLPQGSKTIDPKQEQMQTWLKARLFTYNSAFPFQFAK